MSDRSLPALFHLSANYLVASLMKLLFGSVGRIQVLHPERSGVAGGILLAANHISHFDPFVISSVVRRKIDWMAMEEFFPNPVLRFILRAVDAFPAARDRADSKTIRAALARLKEGRAVGIFPEGGIRDGARSLLEGASLRPGAATLAHMAGVNILPCVIVGTDRLYGTRNWLPFRRVPIWIAFGESISAPDNLEKHAARRHMDDRLAGAFKHLYAELQEKFALAPEDLPHPPRQRMKSSRPTWSARSICNSKNAATERRAYHALRRSWAAGVDFVMCSSMNLLQSRHHLNAGSREEMERYVVQCEKMTAQDYYAFYALKGDLQHKIDKGDSHSITWQSPVKTKFPTNDLARVDLFPCSRGWRAPTVLMLHALMSATRVGYRRWAAQFNRLGWNACFVHLPYHYSRVPAGYWNGELAITADLIRNAEGLRQAVIELRQLIATLRGCGCAEFGLLGTSYGGWIGALLAMVERDFRFVALMAPIVNVDHAIWENPASAAMRRELRKAKVDRELVARHYHLSSPSHNQPLCDGDRVLFVSGEFDIIARPNDIEAVHRKWLGSQLLPVPQGHFGYRMFRDTVAHLKRQGMFSHSVAH